MESSPPQRLLKRPLLILDLNGVLLISTHQKVNGQKEDARAGAKLLYFRPHMREFLEWAHKTFRVAIWSSQIPKNVAPIVECLGGADQFEFVRDRSYCELGDNYSSFKNVSELFADDLEPLIIVDDSPEKMRGLSPNRHFVQCEAAYKEIDPADFYLSEEGGLRRDLDVIVLEVRRKLLEVQ